MTIYVAAPTLNANTNAVELRAPLGFNTVRGLRLSNFAPDTLLLTNIHGVDQSQEYLQPQTQMVYSTSNVGAVPTVTAFTISPSQIVSNLLVEWSDDPENDFPGTYPAALPAQISPFEQSVARFYSGNYSDLPDSPLGEGKSLGPITAGAGYITGRVNLTITGTANKYAAVEISLLLGTGFQNFIFYTLNTADANQQLEFNFQIPPGFIDASSLGIPGDLENTILIQGDSSVTVGALQLYMLALNEAGVELANPGQWNSGGTLSWSNTFTPVAGTPVNLLASNGSNINSGGICPQKMHGTLTVEFNGGATHGYVLGPNVAAITAANDNPMPILGTSSPNVVYSDATKLIVEGDFVFNGFNTELSFVPVATTDTGNITVTVQALPVDPPSTIFGSPL